MKRPRGLLVALRQGDDNRIVLIGGTIWRLRSDPFSVNESNTGRSHACIRRRRVNRRRQAVGMDAVFDARLFSAIDIHLIRER